VGAAEESVDELAAAQTGAEQRISHYERLISTGPSAPENAPLGLMAPAAAAQPSPYAST
jgi:hypothetical protein